MAFLMESSQGEEGLVEKWPAWTNSGLWSMERVQTCAGDGAGAFTGSQMMVGALECQVLGVQPARYSWGHRRNSSDVQMENIANKEPFSFL